MTQAELEALIAKLGPLGPGDFREETKSEEIPNPKYDAADPANNQPNIKANVTYRTWTKPGTNVRLTVKVNPDGATYTKTFDGPDTAIKPEAAASSDWHTEGTPDGNGGSDNTRPIMVRTVNGKRETRQPTAAELKDWNEAGQMTRNPGGKTDAQIATEKKAAEDKARQTRLDEEASARATSTERRAGAAETRAGSAESRAAEEARRKATESTTPDPTGAPPPSYRLEDMAKDLADFDTWLAGKIGSGPGQITVARADQMREQRRKVWEVVASTQQGIVNTQASEASRQTSERGQTLQDQGNRRTNATSISNQASGDFMSLATKLGTGGGGADLMQAIADARNSGQDFVTMTGANRVVAPVTPGPALSAVNAMPLNPRAAGPNALGLGQGGTIFKPQPVAPAPLTPPPAAPTAPQGASRTVDPAQGGGPAFSPPPVVAGPNPATPNLYPPAPPVQPVAPTPMPDPAADGGIYNPAMASATGAPEPGMTPAPTAPMPPAPVDAPGDPGAGYNPSNASQTGPFDPYTGLPRQSQMMPTAAPNFLSAMRPGSQSAYDPTPAAHAMIADPNWDNEAVKEAYRQLYQREMPMPQVA